MSGKDKENLASITSSGNVDYLMSSSMKGFPVTTSRRDSMSTTCSTLADTMNVNQLKKIIAEKDKQLAFIEKKLVMAQSEKKVLQDAAEKSKQQEKSAKILLSAKQTSARRQSIQLMQATQTISKLNSRDNDRVRRSQMRREELEKELEAMDDMLESIKAAHDKKLEEVVTAHGQELAELQHIIDTGLKNEQLEISLFESTREIEVLQDSITKLHASIRALESHLGDKAIQTASLATQLDESMNLNSNLSQEICQLRLREEELGNKHRAAVEEITLKASNEDTSHDFSLQVKENENVLLKEHLDECLAKKRSLESELAALQIKHEESNSVVWRLQDQLESDKDLLAQREQFIQATVESLKADKLTLELELRSQLQVNSSLEDTLTKTLTDMEMQKLSAAAASPVENESYQSAELDATKGLLASALSSLAIHEHEISILNNKILALEQSLMSESDKLAEAKMLMECQSAETLEEQSHLKATITEQTAVIAEVKSSLQKSESRAEKCASELQEALNALEASKQVEVSLSLTLKALEDGSVGASESDLKDKICSLEESLRVSASQSEELAIKFAMVSEAFEATRGARVGSESEQKTVKELQQLLHRSDAELIKRASKNASLQHEVNRLTALESKFMLGVTSTTAGEDKLKEELLTVTSKLEKMKYFNAGLSQKLQTYHDVTNSVQAEMQATHAAELQVLRASLEALQMQLVESEEKLLKAKSVNSEELQDDGVEEY